MRNPQDPSPGLSQHNQQHNQASSGGSVYANQGGTQSINHYNTFATRSRPRTGWVVLSFLVVDVVFFIYGMTAYTGRAGESGDLWRAGIFLVLLVITVTLIRRWFRKRF
jgi:hypothetical protein